MEARRLTLPQVSLYLGAWILAVGAAFLTFFRILGWPECPLSPRPGPPRFPAPGSVSATGAAETHAWLLHFYWPSVPGSADRCAGDDRRSPHVHPVTPGQSNWNSSIASNSPKQATNAQLWWSLLADSPICWWLRGITRAPVFSLMLATCCCAALPGHALRMGMLDWLDNDPGRFYFHLHPCALLFYGRWFRVRTHAPAGRLALFLSIRRGLHLAALSGVAAFHGPTPSGSSRWRPGLAGRSSTYSSSTPLSISCLDRICDCNPLPSAHGRPCLSFRDSGPRDDILAVPRCRAEIAGWRRMLDMAASRCSLRFRIRQHSPSDEEFPGQRAAVLRHRRLSVYSRMSSRTAPSGRFCCSRPVSPS